MKIFYILGQVLFLILILFGNLNSVEKKPYHHLADGSFRNPEGSPKRNPNIKWSMYKWNKEKKKIKINIPSDHIIDKKEVLKNLEKYKNDNYVFWIGHATFLLKLGDTTIITDPLFSKNAGTFNFRTKKICRFLL